MLMSKCVLTLTFLALVSVVFAQEERNAWGTKDAPCMKGKTVTLPPAHLGRIEPATAEIPGRDQAGGPSSLVFPNSQVSAGGVGLRNRTRGHIQVSGVPSGSSPAIAAVMYWAVITQGPAPAQFYTIKLTNEQTMKTASLTGTVVGTGPPPCWPGDTITVFRVLVPTGASGPLGQVKPGNYTVVVPPGNSLNGPDFSDPFAVLGPTPPMWEGASLILIMEGTGSKSGTTAIYDTGIAGNTFGGGSSAFGDTEAFTLLLPTLGTVGPTAFYNIGADGQTGFEPTPYSGILPVPKLQLAFEQTFINGTLVAGRPLGVPPSTLDTDSDWNGKIAGPLPQLWDTVGHTISPGVTPTLDVVFTNAKADCLTQVATVVFVQ
jgi:hypothetical protein